MCSLVQDTGRDGWLAIDEWETSKAKIAYSRFKHPHKETRREKQRLASGLEAIRDFFYLTSSDHFQRGAFEAPHLYFIVAVAVAVQSAVASHFLDFDFLIPPHTRPRLGWISKGCVYYRVFSSLCSLWWLFYSRRLESRTSRVTSAENFGPRTGWTLIRVLAHDTGSPGTKEIFILTVAVDKGRSC